MVSFFPYKDSPIEIPKSLRKMLFNFFTFGLDDEELKSTSKVWKENH